MNTCIVVYLLVYLVFLAVFANITFVILFCRSCCFHNFGLSYPTKFSFAFYDKGS